MCLYSLGVVVVGSIVVVASTVVVASVVVGSAVVCVVVVVMSVVVSDVVVVITTTAMSSTKFLMKWKLSNKKKFYRLKIKCIYSSYGLFTSVFNESTLYLSFG